MAIPTVPVTFSKPGFFGDRGVPSHVQHEVKPDDVGQTIFLVSEEAAEHFCSTGRARRAGAEQPPVIETADSKEQEQPPVIETADSKEQEQRETKPAPAPKERHKRKGKKKALVAPDKSDDDVDPMA